MLQRGQGTDVSVSWMKMVDSLCPGNCRRQLTISSFFSLWSECSGDQRHQLLHSRSVRVLSNFKFHLSTHIDKTFQGQDRVRGCPCGPYPSIPYSNVHCGLPSLASTVLLFHISLTSAELRKRLNEKMALKDTGLFPHA